MNMTQENLPGKRLQSLSFASKKIIAGSFIIMLAGGYGYTLYGALLPFVIAEHGIDYQQAGMVLSFASFGLIPASLASGPLCRKIGHKPTMVMGLAILVGGAFTVIFATNVAALYTAAFCFGAGHGINNNMTNGLVNDITQRNTSTLNLLHACYSLGCVLTPLTVWICLRTQVGWRGGAWSGVAICVISLFACLAMPRPQTPTSPALEKRGASPIKQKRYYALILLLFCGIGVQNGVMGWSTTYFVELDLLSAAQAQQLLSLMWLSMLLGRLVFARVTRYISNERLTASICLACFLLMLCSIPLLHSAWLAAIFVLMGFALSGIYPLVVSGAGEFIQYNPTASGLLFALGSVGGMSCTYLCGFVAERYGMQYSYTVVLILSALALLTSIVNGRWARKRHW